MVARTGQKQRGKIGKKRKQLILIGCEGKNKTEKNYFKEFNQRQKKFTIQPAKGNRTDPKGIVEDTISSIDKEELQFADGDMAFCLFDSDTDVKKQEQIEQAIFLAGQNGVEVLLSVPCFEVWFLQHFQYSTGQLSGNQAIAKIKRFIPEYEKNQNIFSKLEPYTEIAVKNAKLLEKYHDEIGTQRRSINRNPSTEVYKLVEILTKE